MKKEYKGIEFAKGYNRPFANFKQEFENAQVFRNMKPKTRTKELNKAWKIACGKSSVVTKEEVFAEEFLKDLDTEIPDTSKNGNISKATSKIKKTNSRKNSK